MSIPDRLDREINSVKLEVESVLNDLIDLIYDKDKEIDNLNEEIGRLENIIEEKGL